MEIADNKIVNIHYTLKNDAGETLDSSDGKEPMAYLQGKQNIIPGLEMALVGKKTGDKIDVSIPPAEAYGEISADMTKVVSINEFEDKAQVVVGIQFEMQSEEGSHVATVTKVENEDVTLDLNHPLAGVTLNFSVEVMDVRDASEEELAHGHVHGAGGHHH